MILCLTHSKDYYTIDIVLNKLRALGKEAYRIDTDLFSDQLIFDFNGDNNTFNSTIQTENYSFSLKDVEAVWYRKLWAITPPSELDPAFREIFTQEYITMRNIFFESLQHVPWMNPMMIDHEIGNNKLIQLKIAAQNDIHIPESLFTNDSSKVREFFHEKCNGQMIAKLHGALTRSMSGDVPFFPTTLITEDNLNQLDTLRYCPMIFQKLIEKSYELRIAYVDGVFFAGKINTEESIRGKTDWRVASDITFFWEHYELPVAVENALTKMMQQMGLFFGAIDMMRHKDGRYIFLEVNPQGEWGMLQRDLNYPIGETIAEKLIARIA